MKKQKLNIKVRDLEPLKDRHGWQTPTSQIAIPDVPVPLGVEPFGCRKMGLLMLWNKHGAAQVVLDK